MAHLGGQDTFQNVKLHIHYLIDKLVTILSGPDANLAATVAAVMLVCGLFCSIADPRLSDAPEDEFHRIMLANAKRHL
ncbi:hypothetical protein ACRYGU_23735 [Mycobacteroides abscessus]